MAHKSLVRTPSGIYEITEKIDGKTMIVLLHQTLRRIPERIPGKYCHVGIMYSSGPPTYWLYTRYSDGSRHAIKLDPDYMNLDIALDNALNRHTLELINRFCLT